MKLRVLVGTTSDAKNAYIKSCLSGKLDVESIIPVNVGSGVPEQPFDKETEEGARNRATSAYNSDTDNTILKIGIGLEGGLTNIKGNIHLICAVAIYDGSDHIVYVSAPLALPQPVSEKVKKGSSFGVEIRAYEPRQGEVGLVEELISRERSFTEALDKAIEIFMSRKNAV